MKVLKEQIESVKDEVVVRELDDAIAYHKGIAEGGQGEVCLDESMRKQM